jgi:ubiquinone/menaquinone biosynthesis C-methylase UbiE
LTAFDSLAPTYDDAFTNTSIGRYLRERVHARLDTLFSAGDSVLELGCGTGEDALRLARRGVRVLATDASDAMLTVAHTKTAAEPLVTVQHLDLKHLPSGNWQLATSNFSGAFSNFGPLNCLDDWKPLAEWLARYVKPGGSVALGVMSPLCLWEPLWHGLHGDFRTATRRWRKHTRFQTGNNTPILVRYPTIRRLTRDFAPWFERTHAEPLGLFLPPSDVFGMVEKRPRLLRMLTTLEERFARYSWLAPFADHYWVEFRRR